MNNKNILEEMVYTVSSNIYGYGQPDSSDYSKYLKIPADTYFSQIQSDIDNFSLLEPLLCWCMYEAVNIHNVQKKPFDEQKILFDIIKSKVNDIEISVIKENKELLAYARQEAENKLDGKIISFISYCLFADAENILNGHAYWEQINKTVLAKVYMDTINANCEKTWNFPPRFFISNGGHPMSFGPDFTKGPFYQRAENDRISAQYYLPLSDRDDEIFSDVLPEEGCITIEEVCDWTQLDYIIKPELDKVHFPRLYTQDRPYSLRRGLFNLFQLIFNNWADGKKKPIVQNLVYEIYRDFFWLWYGEIPKTEIGYFEGKPAVVYCLYKTAQYTDKSLFINQFSHNKFSLNDEWLHFQDLLKARPFDALPFNIAISTYEAQKLEKHWYDVRRNMGDEQKNYEEKARNTINQELYSLLCMMTFFFIWDMAKNYHTACSVSEKELQDYFLQHGTLQEEFYKSFSDEPWNKEPVDNSEDREKIVHFQTKWTNPEHLAKLMNLVLKAYNVNNCIENFPISIFDTKDYEEKSNAIAILMYNFCNIEVKSKDKLLNIMDFVGELKSRKNIYCQPHKTRKFNSQTVEEEISSVKKNQDLLKNIDCGFEVKNYIQIPVPSENISRTDYQLLRKFTCRFFSDTDKLYCYKKRGVGKRLEDGSFDNYFIDCTEDYRQSNKNNFYCHSLYTAERNTARHYNDMHSLENILDDSFPKNLLEAFRDAKDFLHELADEKKDSASELFLINYHIDFLERHLKTYAQKLGLLDFTKSKESDIWNQLFTVDKNIREEISKHFDNNIDYEKTFGFQYMQEIKWFFQKLYCIDDVFTNEYYSSIAVYLFYLTLRLTEIDF